MKMLILGAAGLTGRHILVSALEDGDDVARAAAGRDAVVSAPGRGGSPNAESLFTRAATTVVEAMGRSDVKRLVWLSSHGVGETIRTASPLQRLMYRTVLRRVYADKAASERTLRAAGLELTIVHPTALTNDPARGAHLAAESMRMRGIPRISRTDVGDFMHRVAHDSEWIGRDAIITD